MATRSQKNMFPLEISVKNEVPSENILVGTLFLTVISRETYGLHILLRTSCLKDRLPLEICSLK
jgi:hypothetical protein